MRSVPYWHVDAFAREVFAGNQAAVMILDAWPDDSLLQRIAGENAFAETAFLVAGRGHDADWELRWFTPAVEVALCGHATLAAGHVLLHADEERDRVRFSTRLSGVLEVRRRGEELYDLALPAIATRPASWPEAARFVGGAPVETWRSDLGHTILLYASADEVLALAPDTRALAGLGGEQFIATARGGAAAVTSRVFVPGAGVDEDAATGSAHAALAPFWRERLGVDAFQAFQASARGAGFACRLDGDRVILGGGCVTVVEGRFFY